MTKQEYKAYQESVAAFFEREGIVNLSSMPDEAGNHEEFFSWSPCECCKSPLGGNRERCNGWIPATKEIREYTICVDCIYFVEYGALDDLTMLDMEE